MPREPNMNHSAREWWLHGRQAWPEEQHESLCVTTLQLTPKNAMGGRLRQQD